MECLNMSLNMNLEIDLSGVDLTPGENIANLVYEENGVFWVDVENLKPV